jgi:hypothetical protein
MKTPLGIVVLSAIGAVSTASGTQSLCTPLQDFVRSVKPGESRSPLHRQAERIRIKCPLLQRAFDERQLWSDLLDIRLWPES